jgi:hypothetical protein
LEFLIRLKFGLENCISTFIFLLLYRKEKGGIQMSEFKKCTKCKRELPLDDFRWKNKAEGKKHSQCKECQKAQEKKHYQESLNRRESVRTTADS